jgi:hypothetical protein
MDSLPFKQVLEVPAKVAEIAHNGTGAYKQWEEARLANAQTKFIKTRLPELARNQNNYLKSGTGFHNAWTGVANSAIERNKTQTHEASVKAQVVENLGVKFAGMADTANAAMESSRVFEAAVTREFNGIRIIGDSLLDRIEYYTRYMQMAAIIQAAQQQQAIKALNVISKHLGDQNSLKVSGCDGPDGFAGHVYEFIRMRIAETEGDNHRFFLYHPDTNWYPKFWKLIQENPLSPTFCAKSDNLDKIVLAMRAAREETQQRNESEDDIVFHLLIPAWSRVQIKEPLHFSDDLQPLRVEGLKHQGKELVQMNLPAAPKGLLVDVANVLDPNSANLAADVSMGATWMVGGSAVNGACAALGVAAATATGLGPLMVIGVWWGTCIPSLVYGAPVVLETVHDAIREDPPRILGSNDRLPRLHGF